METIVAKPKKKTSSKTRGLLKRVVVQRFAISYEDYQDFESEDGLKYEWKDGFAIKSGEKMKNTEMLIVKNIFRSFTKTEDYSSGSELFSEIRCQLTETIVRIPDIALYTREQVLGSAVGENHIPSFVIEIISKNENLIEAETKINEYFEAGVEVIWQVFPLLKQIWVFSSGNKVTICKNNDFCDAINGFRMTVNEVFET